MIEPILLSVSDAAARWALSPTAIRGMLSPNGPLAKWQRDDADNHGFGKGKRPSVRVLDCQLHFFHKRLAHDKEKCRKNLFPTVCAHCQYRSGK